MSGHNLLVFSDVHLGSDLVQHARPDAPPRTGASQRRDRELVALLDWYRERPKGQKAWRLVVAGDLIDFAGMSVSAGDEVLSTSQNEEELQHGLGSSSDHTVAKLARVASHHAEVFAAIARFVTRDNALVIVRGNHDVDFHWPAVKVAFQALLVSHGAEAARVTFSDWFYYEEGVVFVEHGHQYDAYCAYDHVLCPVRPSDPSRSLRSLADVLLRYVVRPTRGMSEGGHDHASAIDYLRFGLRLGLRGVFGLGKRFAIAVGTLLSTWREHMSDAAAWMRKEHERKVALFTSVTRLSVGELRALASLHRRPVTHSLFHLLAGVMIDRVAFGAFAVIAIIALLLAPWTLGLGIGVLVAVALLVPAAWAWRRARGTIDASEALRERATRVAALLPTAFVVMGHTHLPEMRATGFRDRTYVNLGAWAEEEEQALDDDTAPPRPASRTHLVVEIDGDGPRAELLRWDAEAGPIKYFDPPSSRSRS